MTKYYCDFCKKEIVNDLIKCNATIHGFKGIPNICLHGHRECFTEVIGADVVKKAEEAYIENEKRKKRGPAYGD